MKNIANYMSISRIIMSIILIITKTFPIPFYIIYNVVYLILPHYSKQNNRICIIYYSFDNSMY